MIVRQCQPIWAVKMEILVETRIMWSLRKFTEIPIKFPLYASSCTHLDECRLK